MFANELPGRLAQHQVFRGTVCQVGGKAWLWRVLLSDAGWQRISVLGQQAKAFDLELREAVTGDRYVVQVKSRAGRQDLEETLRSFSPEVYRRVFFVVHRPVPDRRLVDGLPSYVDLVLPERLAQLSVGAGLTDWIEDKVA